jgi:glycosyltransferase involved in cell wall biosynthesis
MPASRTWSTPTSLEASAYGLLAARRAGFNPVVETAYNSYIPETGLRRWLYRQTGRRMQQIVAVSDAARQQTVTARDVPQDRVTRIPYGIVPDGFRIGQGARAVIGAEFGIPAEAPLVGVFCSADEVQAVSMGLEALWHVSVHRGDAHLLVIGNGGLQAALMPQARGYQMSDRVHFLGYREDIAAVLSVLDVLMVPCLNGDPTMLLLEAMSLKTPILATDLPGTAELIIDGETGLLVPPGDVDHMTSGLSLLLDDRDFAGILADAAHARIVAAYPFEAAVEATHQLYVRLAAA